MSTVINNPGNDENANGTVAALIGIGVFIFVIILFFLYGLPMIRNSNVPTQEEPKTNNLDIKVTVPKSDTPPPQTQPTP